MILSSKELAEIVEAVLKAIDKHGLTESRRLQLRKLHAKLLWRWMGKTFGTILMERTVKCNEANKTRS